MEKERRFIYCRSSKESYGSSGVYVIYTTSDNMSDDDYSRLNASMIDYLDSVEDCDIVEITTAIKQLFNGISEDGLVVQLRKKSGSYVVSYCNGIIELVNFESNKLENGVSILTGHDDIKVTYSRSSVTLGDIETMNSMQSDISELLMKVQQLFSLEKEVKKGKTRVRGKLR